jgi:hypothetical protein
MPTFSEGDKGVTTGAREPMTDVHLSGSENVGGGSLAPEVDPENGDEKADFKAAFWSAVTWLQNAFRPFRKAFLFPLKSATVAIWWLAVLWVVLYAAHLMLPSTLLPPSVGKFKEELFSNADDLFARKAEVAYDLRENSAERATEVWVANCLFADLDPRVKPQEAADLAYWNRATAMAYNLRGFSKDLAYRSQRYSEELDQFRNKSVWYASVLIVLGMLTTIVSALNSSQFGSGTTLSASTIKIVAIILPALATAITAYSSLNAPADATSMRSQVIYNVASLGAQMTSDLNQLSCSSRIKFDDLNKKVADWSQKYADTVVGIELSQGRPKSAGNSGQPLPAENKDGPH